MATMSTQDDAQKVRQRRDLARSQRQAQAGMIRFVADPAGRIVVDLAERLPGRGVWLQSDRSALARGLKPAFLSRSLRAPVKVDDDLAARIPEMLKARLLNFLGLAQRAGQLVTGFDQVQSLLRSDEAAVLITAVDGAEDGRRKLRGLARRAVLVDMLTRDEIAQAVGRVGVVHAAIKPGKIATSVGREVLRLNGFADPSANPAQAKQNRQRTEPAHRRQQKWKSDRND